MFARMPKSTKTKRLRDSYGFPDFIRLSPLQGCLVIRTLA